MRVEIHQGRITCKVVIRGINTKVGFGNGRAGHVQRVNNLLKIRGGTIRGDVVGENDERLDEGKKSKMYCIFNQRNQRIT